MQDSPFDKSIRLDGSIGTLNALDAPAATGVTAEPTLQVWVGGDGASDSMILAEDLRLLVNDFVHRAKRRTALTQVHESGTQDDIQIAIHGLNLDSSEEQELHRLIRERIRHHAAHKETRK